MALTVVDTETPDDFQNAGGFLNASDKVCLVYFRASSPFYRSALVVSSNGSVLSTGARDDLTGTIFSHGSGPAGKSVGKALFLEGQSSDVYMRAVTVSGTTATFGSTALLESEGVFSGDVAMSGTVDGSKGLVAYRRSDDVVRLCRFTISGSTISPGTPQDHSDTVHRPVAMCPINSNKVGYLYKDTADNKWKMQVIDITSGITEGTVKDTTLDATTAVQNTPNMIVSPDSGRLVAVCPRTGFVDLVPASISGTTLTLGSAVEVFSGSPSAAGVDASGDIGIVAYQEGSNQWVETFDISGTTITMNGDDLKVSPTLGTLQQCIVQIISAGDAMVLYDDTGNIGTAALISGVPAGVGAYDLIHSLSGIPGGILVP